jgi:DNA replication protein DnaC
MQSLKNSQMRSIFKMPDLTPEQWEEQARKAREWEQVQEAEKVRARINAACIPERYRSQVQPYPGVMEWAESPTVGLLLQGGVGRGKTHQACMALMRQAKRGTARFTTFDDLLRECRATYQNRDTEEAVVGRYANTGMLCIDDMGKERPTEWSMPIIFAIINKRSMAGKPTIITTQHTGRQLIERMTVNGDSETARAIISRLMEYTRIEVEGPDWRRGNQG